MGKVKVRLKAYDHRLLDQSTKIIVRAVKKTGASITGPIPLPTKRSVYTVLRSPHVNKKSREQFELLVHSRMIEITDPNEDTMTALTNLETAAGVNAEFNIYN